jgi:hypothetical protein
MFASASHLQHVATAEEFLPDTMKFTYFIQDRNLKYKPFNWSTSSRSQPQVQAF